MLNDGSTDVVLNPFAQWLKDIGIEVKPFKPHVGFLSGCDQLNLLIVILEDVSTTSVYVNKHVDLLRHSYEKRFVGMQFWLGYNPHLLLPDLR